MKFHLRMSLSTLALLFLSTAGLLGGRPITLSDGSVCLGDEGQPVPDTPDPKYQRPFKLSTVFLEQLPNAASPDMKECVPLTNICQECEVFDKDTRSVVVQFRDANATRNVALTFADGMVQVNTVDLRLGDWQPHGNPSDRRKVKHDGKIQWIFVDGQPFDCRKKFCRITFQDDDSTQAP